MAALNLTAAQAALVTSCATSLENAFFSGVTNVGAGFLPALTGYSSDQIIGGGVAAKAAANRTLIKQNFQSVIASLIATLGIQGGSTWNTIATDIAAQQATLTSLQTVVANNAFAVQSTYGAGAYIPGLVWYSSDDNPTLPKAGVFAQFTSVGSSLIFGTSSSYAAGVNNQGLVISPVGVVTAPQLDRISYHTGVNATFVGPSFVPINYETADTDTNTLVTVGAGWVFKAKKAGVYLVTANFNASSTAATDCIIALFKNGAETAYGQRDVSSVGLISRVLTHVVTLAVNDTLQIMIYGPGSTFTLEASGTPNRNRVEITQLLGY